MFRTNNFDKLLDKATSHLLMEPDLPSMLALCDLIRQNDVQPKYALGALKKKLSSTNTHTASFALSVLESMVKNCGSIFHEELTSKAYCDSLHDFAKTTTHENVRQKLLELLQTWSFAFRKNPKHSAIKDLVISMKSEGYKFPAHRESDAMFAADSAPEWADGEVCHRCRVTFNILQRKHHCRACGQVFCGQCTQKTTTLPKFGIEKEVRVCDSCYEQASKPSPLNKAVGDKQDTDLPLEYLNSSLSHQNQEPPRKNEDELREEEELQLAIALSQSEAEAKEKTKPKASVVTAHVAVKESLSVEPPPAALIEEEADNPELAKYLNRSYWESRTSTTSNEIIRPTSPSAPIPTPPVLTIEPKYKLKENGVADNELEAFISTLRSQVEIFINRMKSNSSRGRSIANDTSVQTLFMNITAMHSKLLNYIQQHDDSRLHYERLQDKLTQVKDARAALDALREEHRDKLRREAEEAERLRQLQMAHKLDIMRKKKQEYLQYQRQLALQRIQEQEREMQMRQEQQKQQYLMGPQMMSMGYMVPNVQQYPPNSAPYMSYSQTVQQGVIPGMPPQSAPPQLGHMGPNQGSMQQIPHQMPPPGFPPLPQPSSNPAMNMSQQGLPQQQMNQSFSQHGINSGSGMNLVPPGTGMNLGPTGSGMNVGPAGPGMNVAPQGAGIGGPTGSGMNVGQPGLQNRNMQNQGMMGQGLPPQHYQQPGAPPASPQMQQLNGEAQTAELISFD